MRRAALLLLAACASVPPPPAPPPPVEEAAPEPPPVVLPEPRPEDEDLPAPGDLMEFLYGGRLNFAEGGIPLVTIRVLEGTDEVRFVPHGAMHVRTRGPGGADLSAEPGGEWRITLARSRPAVVESWAVVDERPTADRDAIARLAQEWKDKGVSTRTVAIGNLYGVAGRVLDARRTFLVVDTDGSRPAAEAAAKDLLERFLVRPVLVKVMVKRPEGRLQLWTPAGAPVSDSEGALEVSVGGGYGITVRGVPFGTFIGPRGEEDRIYGGRLLVVVDGEGKLAAVNALPLEKLLRGILPAEIFASAPLEALKSQAVAARGEILAKIGTRHPGEPYLLCGEQHCQAYKGEIGEHPATDLAIASTRGETLFAPKGGPLVNAVYSAVCGGHTENNEVVWDGASDPSLRGVPDFDARRHAPKFARGVTDVSRFVAADVPSFCRLSRFSKANRYRWERRFTAAQVDAMVAELGVGAVSDIEVETRGVSGRANSVRIVGAGGTARIKGELNIRRRFGTLNSAMFEVIRDGDAWVFRGGGWGHGVGMCQMGAMGRAERGQGYKTILAHYYNGAEVVRIYDARGSLAESPRKP